jgi:hypothetical protein
MVIGSVLLNHPLLLCLHLTVFTRVYILLSLPIFLSPFLTFLLSVPLYLLSDLTVLTCTFSSVQTHYHYWPYLLSHPSVVTLLFVK